MNFFSQRSRLFSILQKKCIIFSMKSWQFFTYRVRTRGASPKSILVSPRMRSTTTFVVVKSILDPVGQWSCHVMICDLSDVFSFNIFKCLVFLVTKADRQKIKVL